ncbi:hypothetical protein GKE62_06725 [Novosphingobium sp. Gsoil 351]|nr:hypothetical protein GKE62_06725 [Novosphingobium sp. Gsoil 351]
MRNARITACAFCRQVRFAKPIAAGLDETVIDDVTDDYPNSGSLTEAEKAALRFTDALIFDPALFDEAASRAIDRHFTRAQFAELTLGVMLFLALAKVLITLGLEPEHLDRTELPTPARRTWGASATDGPHVAIDPAVERVLGASPELLARFRRFYGELWRDGTLGADLLAAVQQRIARVHANGAPEAQAPRDPSREALLAYAAQIPFEHHAITDAAAAQVRETLGEDGFVAFTVAAALSDALCRARMVLESATVDAGTA